MDSLPDCKIPFFGISLRIVILMDSQVNRLRDRNTDRQQKKAQSNPFVILNKNKYTMWRLPQLLPPLKYTFTSWVYSLMSLAGYKKENKLRRTAQRGGGFKFAPLFFGLYRTINAKSRFTIYKNHNNNQHCILFFGVFECYVNKPESKQRKRVKEAERKKERKTAEKDANSGKVEAIKHSYF